MFPHKTVTHVPGLICYPCTRSLPGVALGQPPQRTYSTFAGASLRAPCQAGPSPASRRPGVRKAGLSRSPESARGSVLLFVKRGTLNVERAGRRPAAEAPPTFRIRPIRPIRIHWILRQHWQKINASFGLDSRSCNRIQITAHIEFFDHIYFCLLSGLPGSKIGVQAKQFYSLTEESTCFTEHFSIGHHSLLWDFWP